MYYIHFDILVLFSGISLQMKAQIKLYFYVNTWKFVKETYMISKCISIFFQGECLVNIVRGVFVNFMTRWRGPRRHHTHSNPGRLQCTFVFHPSRFLLLSALSGWHHYRTRGSTFFATRLSERKINWLNYFIVEIFSVIIKITKLQKLWKLLKGCIDS